MLTKLRQTLKAKGSKKRALVSASFFKTGKGEYGEGDVFLGLTVPATREVAKQFKELKLVDIHKLLNSKIHEERLVGLLILVEQFKKADQALKSKIYNFYLKNAKRVNNWDLVDLTAPNIVGEYLLGKNTSILTKLAKSKDLWERRIAILATYTFIRHNEYSETLKISKLLLKDQHDLIHKAVGWMLREVGKRDRSVEEVFLKKYYQIMPRTMLRYAIEKFPENLRQKYLKNKV